MTGATATGDRDDFEALRDEADGVSVGSWWQDPAAAILFLDFDGVLHPDKVAYDSEGVFSRMPLLLELLRAEAGLRVVVSSSWREIMPMTTLRALFAPLQDRVVGKTPQRPPQRKIPEHLWSFIREAECTVWMEEHSQGRRIPWLALDDQAFRFSPGCEHLYLVEPTTGLVEADLPRIREWLAGLVQAG